MKQIQCYSVLLKNTQVSLASTPVSWLLGHRKSVKENEAVVQVAWGMMMMEDKEERVVGKATKINSWRLFWHKLLYLKWIQCAAEFQ